MSNYQSPYYDTLRGDEAETDLDSRQAVQKNKMPPTARKRADKTMKKSRLPESLFRKALEQQCGLPTPNDPHAHKRFLRDAVFPVVSQLLDEHGKHHWSLSPRTFSILWVLNIPDKMDSFVTEGRTDRFLPYSEANLPDCIRGSLRAQFIKLQGLVRYHREDISDLEESGKHIHLRGNADAYFHSSQILGRGRFAIVDKVRSWRTTKLYARKQIHRGESMLDDKFQLAAFERELSSLKALSHRHIVKLVGSYTDPAHLGLIMSPIADTDLLDYLRSCENNLNTRRIIRSFFGCLATALAYIHSKNVRHKDIKPNNILIKGEKVFLADFGTSRMCLDGNMTTNGVSKEGTLRYWAPEVGDHANRNRSSDVWSLGCVFLEMATTLFGRTQDQMHAFYGSNGSENRIRISLNNTATEKWIKDLRKSATFDSSVLDWTSWMLQVDPDDRPTAAQLRGKILDVESDLDYICHECTLVNGMCDSEPPAPGLQNAEPPVLDDDDDDDDDVVSKVQDSTTDSENTNQIGPELEFKDQSQLSARLTAEPTRETGSAATANGEMARNKSERSPESGKASKTEQVAESRRVRFQDAGNISDHSSIGYPMTPIHEDFVRFRGLPTDRRPEPTDHADESTIDDDKLPDDAEFVIPEPVKPPPFRHRDCLPLPAASLVPSYILAGTNHFSRDEVQDSNFDQGATTNVFVYGRLMFPSVLHRIAVRSLQGAYSPKLQRRILPTSHDWGKASLSIQRASEILTPARLRGYDRWRPQDLQCAVVQKSTYTKEIFSKPRLKHIQKHDASGKVMGFLIVGIKTEALHYLDLLLTVDERSMEKVALRSKGEEDIRKNNIISSPLKRKSVNVDVELNDGNILQVAASTYVWNCGTADLGQPWNEDEFLRGPQFQRLVNGNKWKEEEQALATIMQISFALAGDYICSAVLTGNMADLEAMLKEGWDPDAPCRYYGNVLQAAVVTGNEEMVDLLLDYGAVVSRDDGRYGSVLIAAAFASRKAISRKLLRKGAGVFATHPVHGSALYQAVGHSDYAIAEMLLEHAAWLTEDWDEIRDLANEIGDSEIQSLLRQYDVREMHKKSIPDQPRSGPPKAVEIAPGNSSSQILRAVVRKAIAVHTKSGNWKGRKGVAVTVAALNAGMSTNILSLMRYAVGPFNALIAEIRRRDELQEQTNIGGLDGFRIQEEQGRTYDKTQENFITDSIVKQLMGH